MMKRVLVAAALLSATASLSFAADGGITERRGASVRVTTMDVGAGGAFAASPRMRSSQSFALSGDPFASGIVAFDPNHAPVYDPEYSADPDPRIGGSLKTNTSGDD
jgi:hypothetical protein